MYAAMAAVLMGMAFSVLRPSDAREFQKWWSRGRFVVMLMFASVVAAVVSAFDLFNNLVITSLLVGFTSDVCTSPYFWSTMSCMIAVLVIVITSAVVMAL